jgi:hypothetical protein
MIKRRENRWARVVLTLVTATLLVAAWAAPFSSIAYSQQRTGRRPQINQRPMSYDRSYLQGYNEGFSQGQADWSKGASRDFQRPGQYQQRDRSYGQGQDSSEDFSSGYNLGLGLGYSDGYYGRTRNPAIPANALTLAKSPSAADVERSGDRQAVNNSWDKWTDSNRQKNYPRNYPALRVPDNTELRLRLTSPINTKTNRVGDRFTAAITSPPNYVGATVNGHIATLNRSGRVSGKTELALAFDSITLADGEQGPLDADLERIFISEEVKKVDEEGRIESGNRTRDSEVRGGVGAAAGAVIGGIAGGGKGALVGLILGGAAGVGTVYVEGNNDLILDNGVEMVIRTTGQRQR